MASWCSGIIDALGASDSGSIPEEAHLFVKNDFFLLFKTVSYYLYLKSTLSSWMKFPTKIFEIVGRSQIKI